MCVTQEKHRLCAHVICVLVCSTYSIFPVFLLNLKNKKIRKKLQKGLKITAYLRCKLSGNKTKGFLLLNKKIKKKNINKEIKIKFGIFVSFV